MGLDQKGEQGEEANVLASASADVRRWVIAGRDAGKAGAFDLAAEAFKYAIRLESEPRRAAQLWDQLGHVRWDQKRYDDAVEAFKESISRDGTFPGPWHDIAQIRLEQRNPAAAVEAMWEAIGRNPKRARYWNTLGVAQMRQGRLAEAVGSFKHFLELEPRSAPGWGNLGNAHCKLGRYPEARAACEKALEIGPASVDMLITIGASHLSESNHAAALLAFRRAAELAPDDAVAWHNITITEARSGNLDQARKACEKLETLDAKGASELREQLLAEGTDLRT